MKCAVLVVQVTVATPFGPGTAASPDSTGGADPCVVKLAGGFGDAGDVTVLLEASTEVTV